MKLETFFEKFELFADAPDAVAKMRGLILRLAMQGELSEPEESDIPVTDLLRDIEKEKAARGIKSTRNVENGSSGANFFAIPSRWVWIQFGEIASHNAGKTLDKGRNRGQLRDYITTSNLYWGFFKLDEVRQMPIEDEELDRYTATKGDLLIVEGGEAGRAAVWCYDYDIAFQNHIHRARFFGGINPYFVQRYFETLNATGHIDRFRKGVGISNMSGKALASIPVPLPPIAEQKRIVVKVDELMALCNRLEAQQNERETRHAPLVRASLARFSEAPTPANLQFLFHRSYDIPPADLRKTILTLAVQGKLVPQDPNDEPAANLVSQIADEKRRLVAAKIIRGKDEAAPIADSQLPFEVPYGWEWTRLSSITRRIHYGYTASAKPELEDVRLLRITDIQNNSVDWMSVPGCEIPKDDIPQFQLERGDILVARTGGTVGKTYLVQDVPVVAVFASYLIRIQGGTALFDRYLKLFLESPLYWAQLEEGARGAAQPNVNAQTLGNMLVPVPPLAEQRRIVAKVDQLMALVNELEQQLAACRTTAEKLLTALVAELTNGKEAHADAEV